MVFRMFQSWLSYGRPYANRLDEVIRNMYVQLDLHIPVGMDNRVPQRQAAIVEYLALTSRHELYS